MNTKINIHDDLITKYLCGEANPDEAISIEMWIAESQQNKSYFENMEQAFLLASHIEHSKGNKEKVWSQLQQKTNPTKQFHWRSMYGVAAVFVLGMCVFAFLLDKKEVDTQEIVAYQNTVHQTLKDNSTVALEKNGHIALSEGFGVSNRKLILSGKAEFTVVHSDKIPFIIESQGIYIEDLGTKFTVDSRPESDTLFVVVNEGIVRLYDEAGNEIIIKAGEKAWYIRSQKKIITSLDTKVLKFDFKDTKLSEVVAILSDTYDVDIQLHPENLGNCTITTQFFDEEIATIITVISETLGLRYEYQNHHFVIEGKPCR